VICPEVGGKSEIPDALTSSFHKKRESVHADGLQSLSALS